MQIKWAIFILAGLLLLVTISLLMYKMILKNLTKIESSNGISSLGEITLGGLKQWIFIRGTDQNNSVLIFLHGGPGAPAPGISSSRIYDAELIKHFTVVLSRQIKRLCVAILGISHSKQMVN